MIMEDELLLTSEAARAAGKSAATIRRWLRSGLLPAMKTRGGVHLIRRADVLRVTGEESVEGGCSIDATPHDSSSNEARSTPATSQFRKEVRESGGRVRQQRLEMRMGLQKGRSSPNRRDRASSVGTSRA